MTKEAELLKTILEDISETINDTLQEEEREGHGPEIRERVLKQIDEVLKLREHEVPPDVLLRATKRLNAFHMLYWKGVMEYKAGKLAKENDCPTDSLLSLILSAFMLGVYRGNKFTLDDDEYFHFMDPLTYKKMGAEFRKRGHEQRQEKIDNYLIAPLKYAEEKWYNGNKLLHNEMANELILQFPELKEKILKDQDEKGTTLPEYKKDIRLRNILMDKLKPIARHYQRVKGEKYS